MTTSGEPVVTWIYFYCGGAGLDINMGRYGSDQSPPWFPPIPDGCTEITKQQYEAYLDEIQAAKDALYGGLRAADRQAEDDRISDLVAAKVADALAVRDEADSA